MFSTLPDARLPLAIGVIHASVALLLAACAEVRSYGQPTEYTLPLYLSAASPGALPPIPNPGPDNYPDLATPTEWTNRQNPTLAASSRLYIWANTLGARVFESWIAVNFHIDGDGPLHLSNLTIVNPNYWRASASINRWRYIATPAIDPAQNEYTDVNMATIGNSLGIANPPNQDGYTDGPTGNVLLGYFDVAYDRSAPGAVWLEVGTLGGAALEYSIGAVRMQMGFGDTSLYTTQRNERSALPEAVFIPEPATLALLLAAGIALRRRR
ncbi:MAG: PEP-CTERM sorting domain-containing protein [Phycisphaerae bacterium]